MIEPRRLGGSGLATVPLMLGGNVFGWTADEATSLAVLNRFLDGGGTLVDTADIYSAWAPGHQGGESESVIGAWLARSGRRDEVLIATKFGMVRGGEGTDISPAHLATAVEASLRRLRTDRIDLYFVHRDDPSQPLEPLLRALDGLVRQGKLRAIGASNFSAARLAEALEISRREGLAAFDVLQPGYNLLDRDFEAELQPLCEAHGLAVVPYFAIGAGFLTGKYRREEDAAGRARAGRVKAYMNERGWRMLEVMDAIGRDTGATLAQIALAWLAAQPTIAAPIASATSVVQLNELLGALSLTLTPVQLEALTSAG
jgi:aryl-alcohol dehydrogenase-like predicted oxidoreductase